MMEKLTTGITWLTIGNFISMKGYYRLDMIDSAKL